MHFPRHTLILSLLLLFAILLGSLSLRLLKANVTPTPADFIRTHLNLTPAQCPTSDHKIQFWMDLTRARITYDAAFDVIPNAAVDVSDAITLNSAMGEVMLTCDNPLCIVDGTKSSTEACDDGNDDNSDDCTSECTRAICGDGYLQPKGKNQLPGDADDEACDDGNDIQNDGCLSSCRTKPLYVCWREKDQATDCIIDGTSTFITQKRADVYVYNTAYKQYQALNEKIYEIRTELGNMESPTWQLKVHVLADPDTNAWDSVVNAGASAGLNRDLSRHAMGPQTFNINGNLYVIWRETISAPPANGEYDYNPGNLHAAVYNGNDLNPQWEYISPLNGINNGNENAVNASLMQMNSKTYAVWVDDTSNYKVSRYAGTGLSWSSIAISSEEGQAAVAALNEITYPSIYYHAKVYEVWGTPVDDYRVHVRVRTDESAKSVDGDFANGLSWDPEVDHSTEAKNITMAVLNDRLYVAWSERGSAHIAVYNGDDDSPSWSFVDGGLRTGVADGHLAKLMVHNGRLYLAVVNGLLEQDCVDCRETDIGVSVNPPAGTEHDEPLLLPLTVTNLGPLDTGKVTAGVQIPKGFALDSTQTDQSCGGSSSADGGILVNCAVGTLAAGEHKNIQVVVTPGRVRCEVDYPFSAFTAMPTDSNANNNSISFQVKMHCTRGCGNGQKEGSEECDSGSSNSDDLPNACRLDCLKSHCGDAVKDSNEECDSGSNNSDSPLATCRADCSLPYCGDGVVSAGETCDDANQSNGDGCSSTCKNEGYRAFVTSWSYNGDFDSVNVNLAGLDGPDLRCQSRANAANLGGNWKAIMSGKTTNANVPSLPTVNARDRFSHINTPIFNMAGEKISDNAAGLWDGSLDNPIQYDETGTLLIARVFTGTEADGTASPNYVNFCAMWNSTGAGSYPTTGSSADKDVKWLKRTYNPAVSCADSAALYCLETGKTQGCGNGLKESGEECDDGNAFPRDGCSTSCNLERVDIAGCTENCDLNICGNLKIDPGEQCDDGNTGDDDGCSKSCQFESGENLRTKFILRPVGLQALPDRSSLLWTQQPLNRSAKKILAEEVVNADTSDYYIANSKLTPSTEYGSSDVTFNLTDLWQNFGIILSFEVKISIDTGTGFQEVSHLLTPVRALTPAEVNAGGLRLFHQVPDLKISMVDQNGNNLALAVMPVNGRVKIAALEVVVIGSVCGNHTVEQGEMCDDGNTLQGDTCSADCSTIVNNHLLFASRGTITGNMGGLAGADQFCLREAQAAGLEGNWKALLSDRNQDAKDRLVIKGQVYNTRNNKLAVDEAGLWSGNLLWEGGPNLVANVDQYGEMNPLAYVFTGTEANGTVYAKAYTAGLNTVCSDWQSDAYAHTQIGMLGQSAPVTGPGWLTNTVGQNDCTQSFPVYCISVQSCSSSADCGGRSCIGGECAPTRTSFCQNGIREGGEECDDGNDDDNDGCTKQCRALPVHRAFVTKDIVSSDFGGLTAADSLCTQQAQLAGLTGDWKAILSDRNTNAKDRLNLQKPIVTVQKTATDKDTVWTVALNQTDLWDGSLRHPLKYNQFGEIYSGGVFTGTDSNGMRDGRTIVPPTSPITQCNNWTSIANTHSFETGTSYSEDYKWTALSDIDNSAHASCSANPRPLYCVSVQAKKLTDHLNPAGPPVCGDDTLAVPETCEPDIAGSPSGCRVVGSAGQCTYCGDNVTQTAAGEVCDGSSLRGQTCVSQGFPGGNLACGSNCDAFDTSSCTPLPPPVCGDGSVNGQETCDPSAPGALAKCRVAGTTDECTFCGDGVTQPGQEVCDGADLNRQTCMTQGYAGGNLGCYDICKFFNTSNYIIQTSNLILHKVTNDGTEFKVIYSVSDIAPSSLRIYEAPGGSMTNGSPKGAGFAATENGESFLKIMNISSLSSQGYTFSVVGSPVKLCTTSGKMCSNVVNVSQSHDYRLSR